MCFAIFEHILCWEASLSVCGLKVECFACGKKDAAGLKAEVRTAERKCEDDSCMLEKLQLERHSASAYPGVAWGV